jgi:long-chain acyl-CoA synthetase
MRPTVAYILPSALFALVRDHDARSDDFSSLRFVVSAGDKLPAEIEKEFVAIAGSEIHEGYGMTEIGTSHVNPPSGPNEIGSVGTNNPTYTSSIRADDDREVTVDTEGRHWVSGPTVTPGYWDDAEATAAAIRGGWLDTGDILKADEDGYLWFRGRRKQIIVHDSSNINPQDVEDAIASHPAVAAVGVVGVHDQMHGENVWAYLTLREGATRPTDQDVIRFARARVGYKAPEVIVVLDEMPLTATGKVDRVALKRMTAERVGAHHSE